MGNVGSSKQRVYSDNDYQLAIEASKELEHILAQDFKAYGQGLHEMVSSVERAIPTTTVRSIRYVATLRNRLIHDQEMRMLPDRRVFIQNFDNALVELNVIINKRRLDAGGAQPFTAPQCVIF
ncbi:hypothetical protein CCR75_000791 [Bremia lactucae]|uniref:Uncharacterized protein n=1 Tax=Bremia lactucae TaxID=4779 RepID=A0A976NYE4_BRELC|nr:hypothetical protein CCR75_000791 [Bremia lactucae]